MIDPVALIRALSPLATELIGLVSDIAERGRDPVQVVARLRALLPELLDAAQDGATGATEDHWADVLRKRFP